MAESKSKQEKAKTDKEKALELALSSIEKQFGKGSIMKMNQTVSFDVPSIPTGSLSLDLALGVGGIPRGRVIEVFGPEASGKTTLVLSTIAQAQQAGGVAAFIDAEHAFDPTYAKKIGVNLDDLLISQPDTGEEALEITETLVRSNAVDLVAIDSVAALTPRVEIEGEMGDAQIGVQARLMSQALRKLTSCISKSKTAVIFINQIRMKIGVMFGNPETTPGGQALKFYSSVRIDLRRKGSIKKGDEYIGNRIKAKVVKNKVAPPFKQAEFDIMFNEGISRSGNILDEAEKNNIITKKGAWYIYENQKIGQGRENCKNFLKENPKLLDEIEGKIRQKIREAQKQK